MRKMMNKKIKELKEITDLYGIGGHESKVRDYVKEKFLEVVSSDDIMYDGIGSIIARKVGLEKTPKIAIAGHMDEIGMIVSKITEAGFIKFQTIGGWWSQVMLAQQVVVVSSTGVEIRGVIGSTPPHILTKEQRDKVVRIEDMFIDIGASSKEEAESWGIKIGDMIAPFSEFHVMKNEKMLLAKAWDNRIGCAIVIDVLNELKKVDHPNTVFGIATVQEEVGLRGARTSATITKPDVVFALDVGIAKDTPNVEEGSKLGKGVEILVYENGMIGHLGLRKKVIEIAEELKIPYQLGLLSGGSTDASAMHLANSGAPGMSLCIPTRYIHSHSSIIHYDDYLNTVKLITEVIKRLDSKMLELILK